MPGSTVVPSHLFTSRPGRYFRSRSISSSRRSAIVEIAYAISKPGALCQTAIAGRLPQAATGSTAINSGGRYVSPLASTAHAMRASLLAKATAATLW